MSLSPAMLRGFFIWRNSTVDFSKAIRATVAKEVGQGLSAEETTVRPDQKCSTFAKQSCSSSPEGVFLQIRFMPR